MGTMNCEIATAASYLASQLVLVILLIIPS